MGKIMEYFGIAERYFCCLKLIILHELELAFTLRSCTFHETHAITMLVFNVDTKRCVLTSELSPHNNHNVFLFYHTQFSILYPGIQSLQTSAHMKCFHACSKRSCPTLSGFTRLQCGINLGKQNVHLDRVAYQEDKPVP